MKNFISLFLTLLFVVSTPMLRADDVDDYDMILTEDSDEDGDNNDDRYNKGEQKGHRSAPMPILCTISYVNGVFIYSVEGSVEIDLYEIWHADGETCIGVYNDERMFLDALYSDKGEYMVVFTATYKKYKGYIWLD